MAFSIEDWQFSKNLNLQKPAPIGRQKSLKVMPIKKTNNDKRVLILK